MRVIFLDFDGVLNCAASFERDRDSVSIWEPAINALARLVELVDAKIVISSAWRYFFDLEELTMLLWLYEVGAEVIGKTPVSFGAMPRGAEIQRWLDDNPQVESFVIIDDEADMEHLAPYLAKTNFAEGLTESVAEKALAILRRSPKERKESKVG